MSVSNRPSPFRYPPTSTIEAIPTTQFIYFCRRST